MWSTCLHVSQRALFFFHSRLFEWDFSIYSLVNCFSFTPPLSLQHLHFSLVSLCAIVLSSEGSVKIAIPTVLVKCILEICSLDPESMIKWRDYCRYWSSGGDRHLNWLSLSLSSNWCERLCGENKHHQSSGDSCHSCISTMLCLKERERNAKYKWTEIWN